jgi:predicted RNA methylase
MADFVQSNETKNAVRTLAAPISDVTTFDGIVQSVITTNPFGCVAYMTAGTNHPGVEKARENYTVRFVYQDMNAKSAGIASHRFNSIAGYNAGATALLAATNLTAAHAGTPVHDTENDSFSVTLRCHDQNGELYNVTFSRDRVTVQSYSDDAILAKVETWADTVPQMA